MKDCVLAYDFGTGGIKASVYDGAMKCLADGFEAYPTYFPGERMHEQAPEAWWQATVASTRRLLVQAPAGIAARIDAIGISGHSLGVVPLDANDRLLLDRVPIWSDARPDAEPAAFFRRVSEREWYLTTGNGFPPALYPVFKLMWFRTHEPEKFRRIKIVLGTKDYINWRLTGEKATDYSYASGSGVYNLAKRSYEPAFLAAADLDGACLPAIVPASRTIGTLTAAAAEALALPRTVRVVAGGVDNACMAYGAGAYREGFAYNSLGSSAWIAVSSRKPLLDPVKRPYVFDHVVPGQYVSALAIFAAGTALRWVREVCCRDLAERAAREGTSVYRLMDEEAATAPAGANGVVFDPSLAGGSSLDPDPAGRRGAFLNLELRHTRADLLRATLEGVARELARALRELQKLTPVEAPLTLVGGGAESPLWRGIFAEAYGMDVKLDPIGQQAAALGAARCAAAERSVSNACGC